MKILFVLCEGPHDAQFVGRLLQESEQYQPYRSKIKDYPDPLGGFFSFKFKNRNIPDLRVGKPDFPQVPLCALESITSGDLVFPISLGGMDKYADAIEILEEFQDYFSPDILDVDRSQVKGYSVLFLYDADARGRDDTIKLFVKRFRSYAVDLDETVATTWIPIKNYFLSIFIFTDHGGVIGTLEDLILELFRKSAVAHVTDTETHFGTYFDVCEENEDKVAHESKRKKGVLTACGQMEKKSAGSALTVVIRDTKLLNGAFDFNDKSTQWHKLLTHINSAFV